MKHGLLSAQVSAGCMLFIHRDCTVQLRDDTADCLLYAQLAATKKHDRFAASVSWSETWVAAMTRFGYVLTHSECVSRSARELSTKTVWDWPSGHLPAFFSHELFSEAGRLARRALEAAANQPAFGLLTRQALEAVPQVDQPLLQRQQKVVVQLAVLGPASDLSLVTLTYTSRHPLSADFLFEPLPANDVIGNVEMRFYSMSMMEPVYASLRKPIREALADKRAGLCYAIEDVDHER